MKSITLGLLAIILISPLWALDEADVSADAQAIKEVIEAAYVKGIHIDQDPEAIRSGFHPEFNMLVLGDDQIRKISRDAWIERIEAGKAERGGPPTVTTTHKFSLVDVTGHAGVARIEVFKNGKHTYTDYMSLYKFSDGWKIVNKIFYRHP
ncbi:MAG: nuclear transport factor 2 family protein [Candidatus Neomarinimicrobiota bacterium]